MVSACPSESDPRLKVNSFVTDASLRAISGLREDGLEALMSIVREEVLRLNPDTKIIILDRDFMADNKVLTAKELASALVDMTFGETCAVMLTDQLPIIKWQEALQYLDRETVQVYLGSLACSQVPVCVKLF